MSRYILVEKSHRRLTLMQDEQPVADFPALVGAVEGPKERSMDHRTPEGEYTVAALLPDEDAVGAGYCKGLHVSYPATKDIARSSSKRDGI